MSTDVQPLTKHRTDGTPYTRFPAVERQIAETLSLPPADILRRAVIREESDPEFLRDETLIYHARAAARSQSHRMFDDLWEQLNRRCVEYTKGRLRSLPQEAAEDAMSEITERLTSRVLDPGDRGDYLEVAFRSYLKARAIEAFSQQLAGIQRAHRTLRIVEERDADDDDVTHQTHVEASGWDANASVRGLLGQAAIAEMRAYFTDEPHLVEAYLLRYGEGRVVGPRQSPGTIANYFEVSDRTVRNWLRKIEEFLAAWRERNLR